MRVEFLIPVYNGGDLLQRAVDSALNQTVVCDVLVIDDGSTDGAPERLKPHPRLRVDRRPENLGLVAALNRGLFLSTAEFIARLDADDVAVASRVEHQLPLLLAGHTIVSGGTRVVDTADIETETVLVPTEHDEIVRALRSGNILVHSSITMNRARVVESGGYLVEWFPAEDFELWLRLARTERFAAVEDTVVTVTLSPAGISTSLNDLQLLTSELIIHRNVARESGDDRPGKPGANRIIRILKYALRVASAERITWRILGRVMLQRTWLRVTQSVARGRFIKCFGNRSLNAQRSQKHALTQPK